MFTANVDEVFVDLCRQMLRREDELNGTDDNDEFSKYDSLGASKGRRRRRRLRNGSNPRCTIL